jgi:hypothetical protein
MDWLILILGVPAVLVPLVLLFGFAGCCPSAGVCSGDRDCPVGTHCTDGSCFADLEPVPPDEPPPQLSSPESLRAISHDDRSVFLTWTSNEAGATFQIQRAEDGDRPQPITISGAISPDGTTDDSGVQEGVTYVYQIVAQEVGRTDSDPSDRSSATVLPRTPVQFTAAAAGFGIALSWNNASNVATEFSLERRVPGGTFAEIVPGPGASTRFIDFGSDIGGLSGGTTYEYQVFAKLDGRENSQPQVVKSLPSPTVSATTLVPIVAFAAPPGTLTTDQASAAGEGNCQVQRFSPTLLAPNVTGSQVRLTLRGSNSGSLTLDNVFISRVGNTGDPYDSDTDLTDLAPGVVTTIAVGGTAIVGPVNYNFDSNQDLLVAVDVSRTLGEGNLRFGALNGTDTFAKKTTTAEAALQDRSANYITATNTLFLIEKIEVL